MTFMQRFYNFINCLILRFTGKVEENAIAENDILTDTSENYSYQSCIFDEDEISEEVLEEKVNVAKRTLMTKLYTLEQEISVFKEDFPKEYNQFLERIHSLRNSYTSSIEGLKKLLTFEIDPETDTSKIDEVFKLEKEIKKFIESTVKFHIISKRLQRLIKKLNILYNVSIFHSTDCEKEKVRSQIEYAIQSETKLAQEFKTCDYILSDNQLKERIIELLSYTDYEILKLSIRNSDKTPNCLVDKLVMLNEFDDFDYVKPFISFIKDELLSTLNNLLPYITDKKTCELIKSKADSLLNKLVYAENLQPIIVGSDFWNEFLTLESTILETLKINNVEKEKVKINIISQMKIEVDENEIFVLPITTANLALVSLFSTTHDNRILLVIKLLQNVSKDITYKELYFLLQLFDVLEIIESTPNDLFKHIEKYLYKYPYNKQTIMKKKQEVFKVSNKEYVSICTLDDYTEEIVSALRSLYMDFIVEGNNVFVNSFYFNGLDNVLCNLPKKANNI